MAWHQISVITDKKTAPKVSDFFSDLGAVSVTYMDAEDQPVYEPPPGETKIWQLTKVIALFELDTEPELVKTVLFSQFKERLLENWFHEVLQDQTWERTWMEHYQPMKFIFRQLAVEWGPVECVHARCLKVVGLFFRLKRAFLPVKNNKITGDWDAR